MARPLALFAVLAALGLCAVPQPAAAINPVKPICTVVGLFSGLVGKLCTAVQHGKQLLSASQKLLGGHLGGALKALSGSSAGKAVTTTAELTAVGAWVVGGAKFALSETSTIVAATTKPQLGSTWFSSFYWRMAGVSALLTLPFLFAAAIQALVRSDLSLLLRSAFGYLPLGMLAVAIAAPVTTLLLAGSDELSRIVSGAAGDADTAFLAKAGVGVGGLSLLARSPFLAFFVGLLAAAAALVLWCELLIRSAAVYVIVLMLPLFFAAMVWPARRVWAVRAVEVLVALILSKFAIVAVLALGGAAIGHTLLPSITQMLAGATLILLAAFSPWALLRMLPLHELAAGAVGGMRAHAQGPLDLGPAEGATEMAQTQTPPLLTLGQAADDPPARTTVDRLDPQQSDEQDEAGEASEPGRAAASEASEPGRGAADDASEPGRDMATQVAEPGLAAAGQAAEPGRAAASEASEPGRGAADDASEPGRDMGTQVAEPGLAAAAEPGAAEPGAAEGGGSAAPRAGAPAAPPSQAPAPDGDETFGKELHEIAAPKPLDLETGGEASDAPDTEDDRR